MADNIDAAVHVCVCVCVCVCVGDIAAAVHGDLSKIHMLGLEAGSIICRIGLAPGVCVCVYVCVWSIENSLECNYQHIINTF